MNLKETTIGLVGNGVVGSASARAFVEHVKEVRVYDIDPLKSPHTLEQVLDCDFMLVCLPTPQKPPGGGLDTTIIETFFARIAGMMWAKYPDILIRSTMPVGTTDRIRRCYGNAMNVGVWPEFLTARCAYLDASCPSRNILGGVTFESYSLVNSRWPHCLTLNCSPKTAEYVKLATNAFFAAKIALWNEIREISDQVGVNFREARELILLDSRINPSHTQVPGPDGRLGFGGECLPKDLSEFVRMFDSTVERRISGVFEAALERNREWRE